MDMVFSSTAQLATAIRAGDVSATEVLEAHLAQIAIHNAALNAIVTMDAERAYEETHYSGLPRRRRHRSQCCSKEQRGLLR